MQCLNCLELLCDFFHCRSVLPIKIQAAFHKVHNCNDLFFFTFLQNSTINNIKQIILLYWLNEICCQTSGFLCPRGRYCFFSQLTAQQGQHQNYKISLFSVNWVDWKYSGSKYPKVSYTSVVKWSSLINSDGSWSPKVNYFNSVFIT